MALGGAYRLRHCLFSPAVSSLPNGASIDIADSILDIEEKESALYFSLTRELKSRPEKLFELSVTIDVVMFVKEEYQGTVSWDAFEIEKELIENSAAWCSPPLSAVSLLISQITSLYDAPLVSPPELCIANGQPDQNAS
jgi:hypothetical protein